MNHNEEACLDREIELRVASTGMVWKLSSSALAVTCIVALPAPRQEPGAIASG